MRDKISNTQKRFRQGRITFKKMKNLISSYIKTEGERLTNKADAISSVHRAPEGLRTEEVETHEHTHDENCHHE